MLLGYVILQMAQRKMGLRKKEGSYWSYKEQETGSYRASRVFSLTQTTLERYVKDRQKNSSESVKTKLGRKQVLPCEAENDMTEHCLLMERIFFFLLAWHWQTSCVSHTYLLWETELKTNFARDMKRLVGRGWNFSHFFIHKFQLELLKVFHSQERDVSLLNQ